jgi:hypothetical protein
MADVLHRLQKSVIAVFALCSTATIAQNGPWNNPLMMGWSADGRFFNSSTIFQDSSGVPSAIRWKGDTLICAFQWFRQPMGSLSWDRVAVKYSYDAGLHWTAPTPIVIAAFPAGFQRPFDPTLVAIPGDSIRLYFSSSRGMPQGLDSTVNTYSAVSADGIHYTFESAPRIDHPTRRVIDPAVIFFNGTWHYASPVGAPQEGAYHYTSPNGLSFFPQTNYPSDNNHNWTGNYLVDGNSALRFYGSGPQIWYNNSPDGFTWSGYLNTNVQGGDPTVVKLSGSNYLMLFVGKPYPTGVILQEQEHPSTFALFQNFPNPFNPSTTIRFSLSAYEWVTLKVFDVHGREVATLVDSNLAAGNHAVTFAPRDLAGGVYFYQLTAGKFSQTRKAVLLR